MSVLRPGPSRRMLYCCLPRYGIYPRKTSDGLTYFLRTLNELWNVGAGDCKNKGAGKWGWRDGKLSQVNDRYYKRLAKAVSPEKKKREAG